MNPAPEASILSELTVDLSTGRNAGKRIRGLQFSLPKRQMINAFLFLTESDSELITRRLIVFGSLNFLHHGSKSDEQPGSLCHS